MFGITEMYGSRLINRNSYVARVNDRILNVYGYREAQKWEALEVELARSTVKLKTRSL